MSEQEFVNMIARLSTTGTDDRGRFLVPTDGALRALILTARRLVSERPK